MSLVPVALYGLEVPCGGMPVPAVPDFPATFRITMAAIDPSEPAEIEETPNGTIRPRATLKIIRQSGPFEEDDSEDEDDEDDETLQALLAQSDSEDESDEDEEEANGGPSDPTKSKKARKQAALQQLLESIKAGGDSDEEMEDATTNGANGTKADKKGKAKATGDEEDEEEEEGSDSSSDDEEGSEIDVDEFVLCTLDPEKNYQQPLDITIGENERVFFSVTGTHTIYLTGNYVISDNDGGHNHHHEVYDSSDDEDDEDYDLSPDEDELELDLDDDESDDLDALENPRITEVASDEEEAPKLVAKAEKKGKNKRSADQIDEGASLDDIMAKSLKSEAAEEPKLTKKQKKLKKNNGEAAPATPESKGADAKEPTSAKSDKSDKKVQFAKNLEQGPTGSEAPAKGNKATLGPKTVNGVKIDDKKLGTGPIVKNGDKVGMRYIGKLVDGKVFDSNKSGKPFEFKVGKKEVIQGWDIGIVGMQAGGERRLTIPPKLAYGSKAMPGLPANSTLVFDVKLINIKR
ncbi:FK506-binding protein 4 [Lachnellula cervina]|uniref:peptidylprolyl isomerase n=1 Tax=Lachnellula cervina TaxID=1316786 RepID=A0A7D8UXA4_9HELO|nr:FK506-binding protein 4 [Lachnellula cervina]